MKKNITTLILATLALVALLATTSCEDIIDVELRTAPPRLVIEATIRMGEAPEVLITHSKAFADLNEYPPVTDAVVTLTDDLQNSETLQCNAQGRYVATTILGAERRTYHLTVRHEDVEYTSTTYMPPRVEITDLTIWKIPIKDLPDPQVHFTDPEGEENQYYRYVLYINGVKPTSRDRLEDRFLSTEYADGLAISMPIIIGYEFDRDEDDPIRQGDVVTVEMQCIDKGAYTFFDTLGNSSHASANPTSNITGGALGYFVAYSYTSKDLLMEWEEE